MRLVRIPPAVHAQYLLTLLCVEHHIQRSKKIQVAITFALSRGLLPLHAVWAGLTATRYVRSQWFQSDSLSAARSGQHRVDILHCLDFSWFYHVTLILL